MIFLCTKSLDQGFPKEGDFKICGDELILDILELQINSKKKDPRGRLPL